MHILRAILASGDVAKNKVIGFPGSNDVVSSGCRDRRNGEVHKLRQGRITARVLLKIKVKIATTVK